MQEKDSTKNPGRHRIDRTLWTKVQSHKHNRALAEKAARISQTSTRARRQLFLDALNLWAKHTPIFEYFPDTTDLCTPEAIFRLCYCNRIINASATNRRAAHSARHLAAHVAYQAVIKLPIQQMRKRYQTYVEYQFNEDFIRRCETWWERLLADNSQNNTVESQNNTVEVETLERRLNTLKEGGDITDSTQCFELERKIYDAKRKLDDDEWPDLIDA